MVKFEGVRISQKGSELGCFTKLHKNSFIVNLFCRAAFNTRNALFFPKAFFESKNGHKESKLGNIFRHVTVIRHIH